MPLRLKGKEGALNSYHDRFLNTTKRNRYVVFFILLFIGYQFVTISMIQSYRVSSAGMYPSYTRGGRLLASPLPYVTFSWQGKAHNPIKRGDVVLSSTPGNNDKSTIKKILNPLLRFISLNFWHLGTNKEAINLPDIVLKRVIALPGDTVKMENYVIYVRPVGSKYFLNEFEVAQKSYETFRSNINNEWGDENPFSSYFDEITLGSEEYFLLGDNRTIINDSRSFGPVQRQNIRAKVVGSYWPLPFFKERRAT
jgi:signal peptidase I